MFDPAGQFSRFIFSDIGHDNLTSQKGNNVDHSAEETVGHHQKTPTPCDDIQIYGEVTFEHKKLRRSKTLPVSASPSGITISGCLDYAIGRVIKRPFGARRRHFQSCLIIVTAKTQYGVHLAVPELIVYLACLHESRRQRKRTDASVYGVSSDGFQFIFVTITHDGTVKISVAFS
jgi:hypothetical protein